MMTYKELQTALKTFRNEGLTQIKLNSTKDLLQAEYDRLTVAPETVTETAPETAPETVTETAPETVTEAVTEAAPETVTEAVTEAAPLVTFHSFRDIIRQRKSLTFRHKAQGFKIVKEKRYDQLSLTEWLGDTLAFLDDDVIIWECDYIAA
jgi:hypothetical protein